MRLLKFLFVFYFLLFTFYFLLTPARAQIPPDYTPCDETGDPEFHSLRPYQASPCGSKLVPFASFCGNDLTLKDTVTAQYPDGGGVCRQKEGEEKIICKFSVSVSKDITIDLSGAELPIMGNTEDVASSQKAADSPEFDSAKKVTEYVSWYLNGVLNRAEYGKNNNTDYNAVNFSGPIQKLLPSVIQEAKRIDTVQAASATRHNQIVVCAQEEILGIWGKTKPHNCYWGNNSDAKPNVYRVENWIGDLSELRAALNLINPLDAWNERIPPLPWNFESDILYRKAYNEWRGKSCLILPLLGLTCIDNPLIRNKWAELYSYIPLSSTEDTKGKISIDNVSSATQPDGATVTGVSFSNQTPADLFFSHTEEADELGKILQNTYAQKGADLAGTPTGVDPAECKTVDVRSNPGDDLFAGGISGTLNYKASFSCEFDPRPPSRIPGPPQTCSKDIYIFLSTKTAVPGMENVWSRLVAGPASVFKKIFPKLGPDSGIGSIKDIPGSTAINYSGGGVSQSTDLKLPHLGGISEYFLKGIQTMLRPKGYGEQITFGGIHNNIVCGKLPDLPKGSGSCSLGSVSSRVGTIPQSLKDIIEAAAETYEVPPNLLLGIMFGESAFEGAYEWTDENVRNWASCEPFPGCDPSSNVTKNMVSFATNEWKSTISDGIRKDLQALDPNKKDPDGCNLLDAMYGLAWLSRDNVDGGAFALPKCFGVSLNTNGSTTNGCDWKNNDYETVIKIWESGTTNMCFTKENSCATGGGSAATCPTGGDTCETVSNRYSKPSHNGCVWDVAHSH